MRRGFTRDMLASGVTADVVKKLLHHTPSSIDAVCMLILFSNKHVFTLFQK